MCEDKTNYRWKYDSELRRDLAFQFVAAMSCAFTCGKYINRIHVVRASTEIRIKQGKWEKPPGESHKEGLTEGSGNMSWHLYELLVRTLPRYSVQLISSSQQGSRIVHDKG